MKRDDAAVARRLVRLDCRRPSKSLLSPIQLLDGGAAHHLSTTAERSIAAQQNRRRRGTTSVTLPRTSSAIAQHSSSIVLGAWYKEEGSVQVETITTPGAEVFYWIAFLIANTLGTAAGDFISNYLGVGFMGSAAMISGALLLIVLLHYLSNAPRMLLFWLAFVLTRPFGATFGDFLTKPTAQGDIQFGTRGASIVFSVILVVAIARETQLERRRVAAVPAA